MAHYKNFSKEHLKSNMEIDQKDLYDLLYKN